MTFDPFTKGKDGIVVKASQRKVLEVVFEFLNWFYLGTVVFALGGDPLPPKINSGDLDGDLNHCIWDMKREKIFEGKDIIDEVYDY